MERKHRVDYRKFTNCLRIAIVPDELQDERIQDVKNYCLQYGFSNVMLFFNAEEYNLGHITKDELLPWLETIKKAKRTLEASGLSVSLNPWMELGHLDRGRTLKDGQNFTTMVDMHGTQSAICACPWDEEWRKYYFELLGWYLREVNPDFLWIEDDFRLHNHPPLTYGGCYCKLHMQKFNEKLGTNYTREEFVEKIFAKGDGNPERTAWLDVNRETMLDLSQKIGDFIQELGLKTRVGLMSSMPQRHCTEARDWYGLHKNLSAGQEKVNRIHLPCYEESTGKQYGQLFNSHSMIVRSLIPNDTYIYPEMENGSFSTFTKDARFLEYLLVSAAPLLISGMTYDIYDFVGNGTVSSFGYGEAVQRATPYLQGVMDLRLSFDSRVGVKLPIDERAAYTKRIQNGWQAFNTYEEMSIAGYLASLGVNLKTTTEKSFSEDTLFLTDDSVDLFSNEQLETLFENNFVIVDGAAVLRLTDRGLKHLIRVKTVEYIPTGGNKAAYEEAVDGFIVEDKKNYRASCQEKAGDYVKIEYETPVRTYSTVRTPERAYFGAGAVETDKFAILPYCLKGTLFEQFNPLRKAIVYSILQKHQKDYVHTDYCGVIPYVYRREKGVAVMIVNNTVQAFDETVFETNVPFSKLFAVDKKGKLVKVRFTKMGNRVRARLPLNYLYCTTLVLE